MVTIPDELRTVDDFHTFLGMGSGEAKFLRSYAIHRYHEVKIKKRSGGTRTLFVPEPRLKSLQRKILSLLLTIYRERVPVHGFVKNRSCITNANSHQGRPYLISVDIKDYFDSITLQRVLGLLKAIGIDGRTATAICDLTLVKNRLPQGAPTSPTIANMISMRLDRELMKFSSDHHLRYTRYADDISFSSYTLPAALFSSTPPPDGRIKRDSLSEELLGIFQRNGFALNEQKLWFSGPTFRKEVTGLIVNEFTNVRRTYVRNIRSALYKIEKHGLAASQVEYSTKYGKSTQLPDVLRGQLGWLSQVRGRGFSAYTTLAKRYNILFPDNRINVIPTAEESAYLSSWVIEYCYDGIGDVECNQGTAFFLHDVGLVTAYHVIENLPDGMPIELYHPSSPTEKFAAYPAVSCKHRDLAILSHNVPAERHLSLPASSLPPRNRALVRALGYPAYSLGDELSEREGRAMATMTRSGVKMIEISANLDGGISGGPVVNERYEVVAVAHKGGSRQLTIALSELGNLTSTAFEHEAPTTPAPSPL